MGRGYLDVEVSTANGSLAVGRAFVRILKNDGGVLYEMHADDNGLTERVELYAPPAENSLDPNNPGPRYATYIVVVTASGFQEVTVRGIQIFDGVGSRLPVNMLPLQSGAARNPQSAFSEIIIPENALEITAEKNQEWATTSPRVMREVFIPNTITVHLGKPNDVANNVTVPFIDYIKNVASSEIYPTWPANSLEANIYCQISLALNRVFTEWYRARGFAFDITNSTTVDQYFVYGRNIYDTVSVIVDRIFNVFIRRQGRLEPFFAEYCNGTTVTCPGLSQWGTVDLANRGYTPIQILRYYYPDDIQLVASNIFRGIGESFPGSAMRQGDTSEDIRKMQNHLNRIRTNYPLIPLIKNPNGYFGSDTAEAVKTFQNIFYLVADGIVGRATWNKIVSVFVAVTRLAELSSEGIRVSIGASPPTSVIRQGAKGEDVVELQFLLNFISEFYAEVPPVIKSGVFDTQTLTSVEAFQRRFGLTVDGVVGPATWRMLYDIYEGITGNVEIPSPEEPTLPPYPGVSLRVGSRGDSVKQVQQCLNGVRSVHPQIPWLVEDGIFGNGTHNAVVIFQGLFGLTQDGVVGPQTWNRIMAECNRTAPSPSLPVYPGAPLRVGSRGANVTLMQTFLNRIGEVHTSIPRLTADGVFGNQTLLAVQAFQRLYGLTPDGIIGPLTWNAIVNQYNLINPSRAMMQSAKLNSDNADITPALRFFVLSKFFGI